MAIRTARISSHGTVHGGDTDPDGSIRAKKNNPSESNRPDIVRWVRDDPTKTYFITFENNDSPFDDARFRVPETGNHTQKQVKATAVIGRHYPYDVSSGTGMSADPDVIIE